tara:strand:- start:2949 stop:3143 length:195 start_codon:yes stop_codon:yes gene_type:complete
MTKSEDGEEKKTSITRSLSFHQEDIEWMEQVENELGLGRSSYVRMLLREDKIRRLRGRSGEGDH